MGAIFDHLLSPGGKESVRAIWLLEAPPDPFGPEDLARLKAQTAPTPLIEPALDKALAHQGRLILHGRVQQPPADSLPEEWSKLAGLVLIAGPDLILGVVEMAPPFWPNAEKFTPRIALEVLEQG